MQFRPYFAHVVSASLRKTRVRGLDWPVCSPERLEKCNDEVTPQLRAGPRDTMNRTSLLCLMSRRFNVAPHITDEVFTVNMLHY